MKQNQIHNLLTVKYKLCEPSTECLCERFKEMNQRGDLVFGTPLSGSMFAINQKER
jgi:hypothetical protein